jgi:dsRNA-specific ribonuclease
MDELKSLIQEDDVTNTENGLVFNPYNSENIEIKEHEIKDILQKYGLPPMIDNINLYKRAFVHKSYVKRPIIENEIQNITIVDKPDDCLPLKTKSNERLEFLGDGILEAITKFYLYRRFPKENEGFMTEKKIALVKNESIGKLAYEMKLNKWLIISKHAEEKKTRVNLKKLGCLFESFLGALYLDYNKINIDDDEEWFNNLFITGPGFQFAQLFVENIFEKHIDWVELIKNDDNYKNIFQVKIQKEFKITPDYLEIQHNIETGYKMGVYICLGQSIHDVKCDDAVDFNKFGSFEEIHNELITQEKLLIFMGSGEHKIKRKAEQMACEEALKKLENIQSSSD